MKLYNMIVRIRIPIVPRETERSYDSLVTFIKRIIRASTYHNERPWNRVVLLAYIASQSAVCLPISPRTEIKGTHADNT